jgi:eukaryotic-like serine/threonine-protein kinase
MLNRRGGEPDVVKVLDFGLVKAMDDSKQAHVGGLSGTPLYMSPEAIQTPDQVDTRSDLYAVGAVGYFLITGQPVFNAASLVELCQQHLSSMPTAPAQRLGREVSPELEYALLACLEKNRAKRPQTARDLANLLDRAPTSKSWSLEEAEAWWGRQERSLAVAGSLPAPSNGSTTPAGLLPNGASPLSNTSTAPPTTSGFDQTQLLDEQRRASRL